ncbi:hypothetical protein V0U79_03070 [Hyphobacterium sp. HN65]|uniref:Uncharacterized protein n=1 Tax=Hyphobacterium lacteum TaxID=3116575 RepID=A0ABU7LN34_9PROT|nr:hypothetical protein [Hyphobacterium sp. HN65]MEE2525333.1 hypothetical protein [Hyphobacterium sp. HN65]
MITSNHGITKSIHEMGLGEFGLAIHPSNKEVCLVMRADAGTSNSMPIAVIFGKMREDDKKVRPYWVHATDGEHDWGTLPSVTFPNVFIEVDYSSMKIGERSYVDAHNPSALYTIAHRSYFEVSSTRITGDSGKFLTSGRLLSRGLLGPVAAYDRWKAYAVDENDPSIRNLIFEIS